MPSFNKVILLGNLTRDPEVRYTPNGAAVASFTLAVNEKYKQGEETKERVDYVDCVAWNKQAENIGQYQRKGDLLLVEGKLQQRKWEDKDTGQKRSKIEVVVMRANFMPRKNGHGSGTGTGACEVPPEVAGAFEGATAVDEGEIPF